MVLCPSYSGLGNFPVMSQPVIPFLPNWMLPVRRTSGSLLTAPTNALASVKRTPCPATSCAFNAATGFGAA